MFYSQHYSPLFGRQRASASLGDLPLTESQFIAQAQATFTQYGYIPLYRFDTDPPNVFRNPINGAIYYSEDQAAGAAGQRTAAVIPTSTNTDSLRTAYISAITSYYRTYLGREPDALGTGDVSGSWLSQLLAGTVTLEQVRQGIANSQEAQNRIDHTATTPAQPAPTITPQPGTQTPPTTDTSTTISDIMPSATTETTILGIPAKYVVIGGIAVLVLLSGDK